MRNHIMHIATFILLLISTGVFSQYVDIQKYELLHKSLESHINIPELPLEKSLPDSDLPYSVDNTSSGFLPSVYIQIFASCGQDAGIGMAFAYEINRIRNVYALEPENNYSSLYTYNFLYQGDNNLGISYFDSWDILQTQGQASAKDFMKDYGVYSNAGHVWMNGYMKYFRAMHNRIDNYYAIGVGDEKGLNKLKHWLNNHLDG